MEKSTCVEDGQFCRIQIFGSALLALGGFEAILCKLFKDNDLLFVSNVLVVEMGYEFLAAQAIDQKVANDAKYRS